MSFVIILVKICDQRHANESACGNVALASGEVRARERGFAAEANLDVL
jgi:hypothetical protein